MHAGRIVIETPAASSTISSWSRACATSPVPAVKYQISSTVRWRRLATRLSVAGERRPCCRRQRAQQAHLGAVRCDRIGCVRDTPRIETGHRNFPDSREKFVPAPEIRPLGTKNLHFVIILRAECEPDRSGIFGSRQGNGSGIAKEATRGLSPVFVARNTPIYISLVRWRERERDYHTNMSILYVI